MLFWGQSRTTALCLPAISYGALTSALTEKQSEAWNQRKARITEGYGRLYLFKEGHRLIQEIIEFEK